MPYSFSFGTKKFDKVSLFDATQIMEKQIKHQRMQIQNNYDYLKSLQQINDDQPVVSFISNLAGGASKMPTVNLWNLPDRWLNISSGYLQLKNICPAYYHLEAARVEIARLDNMLQKFGRQNIVGADRAIVFFTYVKEGAIVVEGAIATKVMGPVLGSAYGAAYEGLLEGIQQKMEVHYGLRDQVDWLGISVEIAYNTVIGVFEDKINGAAGKLADKMFKKTLGKAVFNKYLKNEIKETIVEVIVLKSENIVKICITNVVNRLSGKIPPVTWEIFFDELEKEFSAQNTFFELLEARLDFKKKGKTGFKVSI